LATPSIRWVLTREALSCSAQMALDRSVIRTRELRRTFRSRAGDVEAVAGVDLDVRGERYSVSWDPTAPVKRPR